MADTSFFGRLTKLFRAQAIVTVDKEGRKYRLYSIRKWHINKSIQAGEDRFQIADRVGHTYAVLEKFYLNKEMKQNKKADLWQTTKTGGNEKVV